MTTCTNTDVHTRVWTDLVNKETGTTLELEPGASADVDLPEGFEDTYLVPQTPLVPPVAPKGTVTPDTTTTGDNAGPTEES